MISSDHHPGRALRVGPRRRREVLPGSRSEARPVFDAGRSSSSGNPEARIGLQAGLVYSPTFRCTDRDKQPPRQVVTAMLLGDPARDRVAPEIPEDGEGLGQGHHKPVPVYLTFAAYRAAYGETP